MKKFFIIAASCVLSLTACADHYQLIKYPELPTLAQTFIQKHFNQEDNLTLLLLA